MTTLSRDKQLELENFIRENLTQEDLARIALLMAKILNTNIQGLTLKEALQKIKNTLENLSSDDVNVKLGELLTQARGKQQVTTGEGTLAVSSGKVKPQHFVSPNTKAANRLFADDNSMYYQGSRWLAVEGKNSKKEISVSLFVKFDECLKTGIEVFMTSENKMLSFFDRTIHDAVVAHILNGSRDISTNMIYQVISGNSDGLSSENPVPKSLSKAISESINRLFHSWVEIDATEHVKKHGFDDGVYKGHLLTGSIVEASLNGNVTTCAHIAEIPILFRYADDCKQVVRYDVKALNVPALENSVEGVVLKTYLLQQISIMSHNENYSRIIRFDTLFNLLNVQGTSEAAIRMKKKQVRDHTTKCLDFWAAEKIISGYTLNREGRAIVSVTLKIKATSKSVVAHR